jgi:hypothetical protein
MALPLVALALLARASQAIPFNPKLVALALLARASQAVPFNPKLRSFGFAIKNGPLPGGVEQETFAHNCTLPPCAVTQLHFPSIYPQGACPWDWENGRFRVYVDGEATPSIDVTLLQMASVGSLAATGNSKPADGSPFGNDLFGKTSVTGGVFSTVRIPFMTSIETTITAPPSCATGSSIVWFIIRGVEGLPVTVGDIQLPDQARLSVQKQTNVTLAPGSLLPVATVPSSNAGLLLMSAFEAVSGDYNFLEACVRFFPDDPAGSSPPTFLSSGTEDYFLSASYFDEGQFTTPASGLTYKAGGGSMAAYKVHTRDTVLWQAGMLLDWKNDEDASCPTHFGLSTPGGVKPLSRRAAAGTAGPAAVSTTVWLYTWPSAAEGLTFGGVPAAEVWGKTKAAE